jgi:phosphoribosylanthranilate isomerase
VVQPAGVDAKTKTDKPGTHVKDLEKVRAFVAAAKSAASA